MSLAATLTTAWISLCMLTHAVHGQPDNKVINIRPTEDPLILYPQVINFTFSPDALIQVKEGDIIVTSGVEKYIPAGLIIGKVSSVEKMNNDIFQTAKLVPFILSQDINIVTVIK